MSPMSQKPNKWYHTQNWWNSEIVDSWENAVYIGCIEIVEEKKGLLRDYLTLILFGYDSWVI